MTFQMIGVLTQVASVQEARLSLGGAVLVNHHTRFSVANEVRELCQVLPLSLSKMQVGRTHSL